MRKHLSNWTNNKKHTLGVHSKPRTLHKYNRRHQRKQGRYDFTACPPPTIKVSTNDRPSVQAAGSGSGSGSGYGSSSRVTVQFRFNSAVNDGTNLQKLEFARVRVLRIFANKSKKFAKIRHTLRTRCRHFVQCPLKMATHSEYRQHKRLHIF